MEEHEAEVAKVKKYLHDNRELFNKVSQGFRRENITSYWFYLSESTIKLDP